MEWEVQDHTETETECTLSAGLCMPIAQQVGCPSKISTVLAINIITNGMPNKRYPPHFAILQASRGAERRYNTWQVEVLRAGEF